jgi:hypothetical protein
MNMEPPEKIDGAKVLYWAWSGNVPFFLLPSFDDGAEGIPIHGLAICQYDNGAVYRFSCNQDWMVKNDSTHHSIEDAMSAPSGQYNVAEVRWQLK